MAGVVRLQGLQRLRNALTGVTSRRSINSSSKKCEAKSQTQCAEPPKENWVSYGFDRNSKTIDRNVMKQTLFVTVTLCLVIGGFGWSYLPDPLLKDWAQREAYLLLRYREENGLPLIDRNFIDPAKIKLPSDEELGDTEIII
ncbi:NADH dehydrogenase [ubiquinone] 1 beta subcomplex subunit 11, mitochondrial [Neodiprion pinetum]|uniref:NADH dehydrogenase [ubiquinone] 1 beta subcomplex subunit 11, mitochondrial n=1 Tax=Neodiprion lecontei TaxID=441921 RepID=A0A6J0C355_NEOLC|nr:NADH dehydrogenase [ubiquinone] 1 beta subcomplex subunit 11, mitochondrial [Neodiprion lecontei]XP_046421571.1 NADH dehydrogenase [ubiquinone] 1 beta subcomplex subunit 11, mitochondrial [Neodiprion fabricii]XP_046477905.1 NADH dehydrogenase [ubiquinone] 1 beta subcomplex subunit 11, mitochondrial [Neodiprion pinetum]XP_046615339.1 NADH dehydrogenase [ubiquinone] 1 beta subcomplex subunit 11, mitochondrial [Neodiprion virginianus]